MGSWAWQIKLVHIFQIVYRCRNLAVLGWKKLAVDLHSIGQIFQPKEKSKHFLFDILKKTAYCWDISKLSPVSLKRMKKRKQKPEAKDCKAFIVDWIKYFKWLKVIRVSHLPNKKGSPLHPSAMTLSFPSLAWPAKSSSDTAWDYVPWGENVEIAAPLPVCAGKSRNCRI